MHKDDVYPAGPAPRETPPPTPLPHSFFFAECTERGVGFHRLWGDHKSRRFPSKRAGVKSRVSGGQRWLAVLVKETSHRRSGIGGQPVSGEPVSRGAPASHPHPFHRPSRLFFFLKATVPCTHPARCLPISPLLLLLLYLPLISSSLVSLVSPLHRVALIFVEFTVCFICHFGQCYF